MTHKKIIHKKLVRYTAFFVCLTSRENENAMLVAFAAVLFMKAGSPKARAYVYSS